MALKADRAGFLVGEPISIDRNAFAKAVGIWRAIRSDTAALRESLLGELGRAKQGAVASPRASNAPVFTDKQAAAIGQKIAESVGRKRSGMATPVRARGADGRFAQAAPVDSALVVAPVRAKPAAEAEQEQKKEQAPEANKTRSRTATPTRGKNGRFLRGDGDPGDPAGMSKAMESLGDAVESLKGSASSLADTAEGVDPTVTAAKELGEIVSPVLSPVGSLMKKGFGTLFRRDDESIPWYRRIYGELRDINKKSGGGGGGGMLGMLSKLNPLGLLKMLPGAGMIGKALGGLSGLGGRGLAGMLGKLALPIGAMISSVQSFNTSTEEYARRMGVELNGSLAQELGVRFVGVLGDLGNTLTLGLAGKFGEYIGPAVADTFTAIGDTWDGAVDKFNQTTDKMGKAWDGAINWLKEGFDKTVEKAGEIKDSVVEKAGDVKEAAGNWVADKADAVASTFGKGSAGNRKALISEMANSGITDRREQAAFLAQMDHESGGFRSMEESFKYRSADRLMGVSATARGKGKEAVEAAMAQGPEAVAELMYGGRMGNTEKGDAYKFRGRGFTQLTGKANYAEASKALGVDLLNNPDLAADPAVAAKVSAWYWKKSGAGDAARSGNLRESRRRVNGGYNGMEDVQQKYDSYMAAMNTGVIDATGKPKAVESNAAAPTAPLVMASSQAAASTPASAPAVPPMLAPMPKPASARMAAPTLGSMAPAPASAPGPSPAVQTPIGSSSKGSSRTEVKLTAPISQNVSDRSIAHVATGGIGGG